MKNVRLVGAAAGNAAGLSEVPVQHHCPDPAAQRGPLQSRHQRGHAGEGEQQDEQPGHRNGCAQQFDVALQPLRGPDVHAGRAEDVPGGLLQDQRHPERDQQGVQGAVVHPAQQGCLEDQSQQPAHEEAHRQDTSSETPASEISAAPRRRCTHRPS